MHSLFWKFFFSFWAALILFVIATVWTTSLFWSVPAISISGSPRVKPCRS